jgi:hypothetical protein
VVLGGGNVKQLKELPAGCRAGDNANAFLGGYRLWDQAMAHMPSANRKRRERATGRQTRTTVAVSSLTDLPAWKDLETHYEGVRDLQLRTLFKDDSKRGERMTAEAAGIYLDYSKQRITDETLKLLMQLAEQTGLRARIDAMFRGSIR